MFSLLLRIISKSFKDVEPCTSPCLLIQRIARETVLLFCKFRIDKKPEYDKYTYIYPMNICLIINLLGIYLRSDLCQSGAASFSYVFVHYFSTKCKALQLCNFFDPRSSLAKEHDKVVLSIIVNYSAISKAKQITYTKKSPPSHWNWFSMSNIFQRKRNRCKFTKKSL